ncbi:MAG: hypothetical protein KGJ09_09655 [Candidatus Omnitrophica bacterium]|nr:hypothetical protein [Candidatus Omnitrophota bacterium]MDE2215373.1 hypothetical protein [Candidatus Omnitrophota bacterium]
MKISVLLPSLYPRLAARAIASLRKTSVPLEIVCCGPSPIPEADVSIQAPREGVCKAQRACYAKSTGDMLMLFSDDVAVKDGWAEKSIEAFDKLGATKTVNSFILNLCSHPVCVCTCFGRAVANFPLFHRSVVDIPHPTYRWEKIAHDFGPAYLYSEWSDVALSMAVWEQGGMVKRMSEQLVFSPPGPATDEPGAERLGCPEPSRNTFEEDCSAFLRRFRNTVGLGWPCNAKWWRAFNIDCWPGVVKDDTVFCPSYYEFMQMIRRPPDVGGGSEFGGDMRWRCREHPDVVYKDRLEMPFQCSLMAELTA